MNVGTGSGDTNGCSELIGHFRMVRAIYDGTNATL